MENTVIKVGGMSCQGCVKNITGVLGALAGVRAPRCRWRPARQGGLRSADGGALRWWKRSKTPASTPNKLQAPENKREQPCRRKSQTDAAFAWWRLRLQDRPGRPAENPGRRASPASFRRNCWSAPKPATTRRCTRSIRSRRLSRPPISSCPSSTIPTISGASPRPMPFPMSMPWAARRYFALALVGMPVNVLPLETIGKILKVASGLPGGRHPDCRRAHHRFGGADLRTGRHRHLVNPAHLKRNSAPNPGDKLILGKPLGVGVYSAALKKGSCCQRLRNDDRQHHPAQYAGAGAGLSRWRARGDRCHRLRPARPPDGGVQGQRRARKANVKLAEHLGDTHRALLTDPQTSGGLLVSCTPDTVTEVLSVFLQQGFSHVSVIGEVLEGDPGIDVS
jgi:selenide,water dikinase